MNPQLFNQVRAILDEQHYSDEFLLNAVLLVKLLIDRDIYIAKRVLEKIQEALTN
jgi:hypothetical protein